MKESKRERDMEKFYWIFGIFFIVIFIVFIKKNLCPQSHIFLRPPLDAIASCLERVSYCMYVNKIMTFSRMVNALFPNIIVLCMCFDTGLQYITYDRIERLHNCAATLLMRCGSGALELYGCYVPKGAPLSYLLAGSSRLRVRGSIFLRVWTHIQWGLISGFSLVD